MEHTKRSKKGKDGKRKWTFVDCNTNVDDELPKYIKRKEIKPENCDYSFQEFRFKVDMKAKNITTENTNANEAVDSTPAQVPKKRKILKDKPSEGTSIVLPSPTASPTIRPQQAPNIHIDSIPQQQFVYPPINPQMLYPNPVLFPSQPLVLDLSKIPPLHPQVSIPQTTPNVQFLTELVKLLSLPPKEQPHNAEPMVPTSVPSCSPNTQPENAPPPPVETLSLWDLTEVDFLQMLDN